MPAPGPRSAALASDPGLVATIAELYYKDGRTQQEIARRLGLSRATIINYLKQGRDEGIIDIQIKGSAYTGSALGQRLAQAFDLAEVYVTRTEYKKDADEAETSVARLGAAALGALLRDGDSVGVAWGRTIQRAAEEMPITRVPGLAVLQIWGSVESHELLSSEASTIRFAERLGADCHTLHVPAILSTEALAQALRQEPVVRAQLERLERLDKVIFSVGDTGDGAVVVETGIATQAEIRAARAAGAKAVLCGHFLNADGAHIHPEFSARVMGMRPDQIKSVPSRILVAANRHNTHALLAALRGGLATHLVIDAGRATELVELV